MNRSPAKYTELSHESSDAVRHYSALLRQGGAYTVKVLSGRWHAALSELVSSAQDHLTIAAPYISETGVLLVTSNVSDSLRKGGSLDVLTDLSPAHVSDGSLQPEAVQRMVLTGGRGALWHVPCLHAKVYLADNHRAIVTSGNLTAGAFYRNVEYGVEVSDPRLLKAIENDLNDLRVYGTLVAPPQLDEYVMVAKRVRETYQRQQSRIDPELRAAFAQAVRRAEDELIRFRLAGGAMHTVFARTIHHLLQKNGPLNTVVIHTMVQALHPDLCDDSIDRVIDGKRFGKKWKHAVRTAQQQLKRSGLVGYDGELWYATS